MPANFPPSVLRRTSVPLTRRPLRALLVASLLAALFAEELGALLQIRAADRQRVMDVLREEGVHGCAHLVGHPNARDELCFARNARPVLAERRADLQRAWAETTYRMQALRDNPACALEEHQRLLDVGDPGLSVAPGYDPADDVAAPFVARGARPRIAVLREQGVNGQVELAAAFHRAGFEAHDVHVSDLLAGRASLAGFKGFAAGGGFSYGDVLGAGQGWAKSILLNERVRSEFEAFFARDDTFALGVCNGCQMMAALKELIPGAAHWPAFVRNRSEQFEARVAMVEVVKSPSLFLAGMEGSRMPIAVAHGEGRAEFADAEMGPATALREHVVALRWVNNYGDPTEIYPFNPNGSPLGISGLTTRGGRVTIMMPHPERVFRAVQHSWGPDEWFEDGPWMRMFRNARKWVG